MTGCMILQVCNMFKASTPAKIGLIDSPLQKIRQIVYRETLNGEDSLKNIPAAIKANKATQQVFIYPLTTK